MAKCRQCFREMDLHDQAEYEKECEKIVAKWKAYEQIKLRGAIAIRVFHIRFLFLEFARWRKEHIQQMMRFDTDHRFDFYGFRLWPGVRVGVFLTNRKRSD